MTTQHLSPLTMLLSRHIRRWAFITLVSVAAASWSLAASTQQAAVPVIGFLSSVSHAQTSHMVAAFQRGLGETGHVEGRNVGIEYRFADGQYPSAIITVSMMMRTFGARWPCGLFRLLTPKDVTELLPGLQKRL